MFDGFKKNDYILIQSSVGEGAGNFEINKISDLNRENINLCFPLVHDYLDDFKNKSQVIRIPQHSEVKLENGKTLFIKAQKDGLGGIIAIMANSGFKIKGYISDSDSESSENKEVIKNSKSKSSIVCLLANYSDDVVRKVVDFKFSKTFPMTTLPTNSKIYIKNINTKYNEGGWQHLSIPPDLNLHLTNDKPECKDYLFFKPKKEMFNHEGYLKRKYTKLFSISNPPIDSCPIFTNKKYAQCLMIAMSKMKHWSKDTHFTLEVFALKNELVKIPKSIHCEGDLGVIHPFPCSYIDVRTGEKLQYWLRIFMIASHNKNDCVVLEFGSNFKFSD